MSLKNYISSAQRSRLDPYFHLTSVQGITTLTDYQVKLTRRVKAYDRLAIKACHGMGKTWWSARIVLWFLSTFPGSKVITTAPTGRMVKQLLWSEINSGFRSSHVPLGGEMLTTEWKIEPGWFAIGFSPQKEAASDTAHQTATTFQGFHSKYMLLVLDEATGIPQQIWDQLEGMTTGGYFKLVAIGNPTSKASKFFECFYGKKSSIWRNETIRCFDSPNLKINNIRRESHIQEELERLDAMSMDEKENTLRSYSQPNPFLVTSRWVMERALEWGIEHPLFRSKVLAEFPEEDENALFTLTQVTEAIARQTKCKNKVSRRCIGVDPARFGSDKTIITVMEDEQLVRKISLSKKRTTYVTGKIIDLIRELNGLDNDPNRVDLELILVDGTGLGSGVVDQLLEARESDRIKASIIECHFGGGAADKRDTVSKQNKDKEHFLNFKAKIFHLLSKDLSGNIVLPDENDSEVYQDQLPSINYNFDSKGKLKIESKDDYKRRTGRHSPDEADSFALANWGRHVKIQNTTKGPWAYRL